MAQFPSSSNASGIWLLKDQRNAVMGSNWPTTIIPAMELILVAGGGGGGRTPEGDGGAAGGGAGGLLYYGSETPKTPNGSAIPIAIGSTYTIAIGGGGNGSSGGANTKGSDSTFSGNAINLTSFGGGRGGGGSLGYTGDLSGGSGGGVYGGTTGAVAGQGNIGGASGGSPYYAGGGGNGSSGGANTKGSDSTFSGNAINLTSFGDPFIFRCFVFSNNFRPKQFENTK